MKVYYINSELQGCYNVRCLYPLQANCWDGDRTTLMENQRTAEDKTRAVMSSDIIVYHRPDRPEKLQHARILKKLGKKIVCDNDDTFKDDGGFKWNEFMDEERYKNGVEKMDKTFEDFMKEADLVTCSTEFLAEEYRKVNPNVVVLKNCIDPFYFPDEIQKNETDKIRIGFTGSVAMTSDLEVLKPIIEHYQNDPRVELIMFSMPSKEAGKMNEKLYSEEYKYFDSVNLEWHTFVKAQDYYEKLNDLKLDISIIPRADTYFNRCKSNLKFLENSMLEIPTIAQSFPTNDSPYEQNPKDKDYLLLATDTSSWIEQIEKLINDKELRLEIGKKAKKYVEEEYNIENNAHLWEEAYETLLDNK